MGYNTNINNATSWRQHEQRLTTNRLCLVSDTLPRPPLHRRRPQVEQSDGQIWGYSSPTCGHWCHIHRAKPTLYQTLFATRKHGGQMTQPQIGQLYQYNQNPEKIIMVTHYHQARKQVMTKGMTPTTKSGWRSALALRTAWTPITQANR